MLPIELKNLVISYLPISRLFMYLLDITLLNHANEVLNMPRQAVEGGIGVSAIDYFGNIVDRINQEFNNTIKLAIVNRNVVITNFYPSTNNDIAKLLKFLIDDNKLIEGPSTGQSYGEVEHNDISNINLVLADSGSNLRIVRYTTPIVVNNNRGTRIAKYNVFYQVVGINTILARTNNIKVTTNMGKA